MFILAIGLMGVLALFPMGVLQMAQAVKDERTAQTGIGTFSMPVAASV